MFQAQISSFQKLLPNAFILYLFFLLFFIILTELITVWNNLCLLRYQYIYIIDFILLPLPEYIDYIEGKKFASQFLE